MHAKPPAGIAIVLGPPELEHPDFNGPGFLAAKKQLIMSPEPPPEGPELSSNGDMEAIHAELLDIARQMREGADLNADLASQIEEVCEKLYHEEGKASPDNGEAQELY